MTQNGKEITIKDLMRDPVFAYEGETLKEVLTRMIKERRNSLTVVAKDGTFKGAVSALDIIKEVIPEYIEADTVTAQYVNEELFREDARRVAEKPVEEFMVTDIPTITLDTTLIEAAVIAIQHGRGRITVIDAGNKPIGVLTRTELKRVIGSYLDIEDTPSE